MKVELSPEELDILIDYLPPSYKEETPKKVTALKLRLLGLSKVALSQN
jgi:hypothetical protein